MSDESSNDFNSHFSTNISMKYKQKNFKLTQKRTAKKQKWRNAELSQKKPFKLIKLYFLQNLYPKTLIQCENIE